MQQIVPSISTVENRIRSFFHNHTLGQFLRQSYVRQEKGVELDTLFQFMLSLVFAGKNLFRLLESPDSPDGIGKDMIYRLLNSVSANWRHFLLLLSTRIVTGETDLFIDISMHRSGKSEEIARC